MGLFGLATHGLFCGAAGRSVTGVAHEIINAFDAMVIRLQAACQPGQPMENILLIEGPNEEIREQKDLPYVEYALVGSGFLEDTHLTRFAVTETNVLLRCGEDKQYGYYNVGKTRGALWLYERLQNAIDGIDLGGGGHWYHPPKYAVSNFEVSDLRMLYDISVTLTTSTYQRGTL